MIGKKINQLATELAPVSTDLTIIGDPVSGVSKKITLAQLGAIFSGAVSFYTNYASFPATGDINVIYCAKDTQKLYLWSGSAYVEVSPSQALLDTYQLRSEKGNANGYASLDSQGKVPISQLPSSIMEYKGTWNAATNTPTLANGTGDTGDVYICNVAGTVNFGAGPITFAVGDYVIYSGTIWQRSSGAVGTVTSVAASITGDAIGITGSPVTTSGTLAFAFGGNSTQYINGAGNLITFPSIISQAANLVTEVYNKTGATLTKGTIVYINGGQGNLPTVTKAIATGDSTSAQTFGIVQADITNNNNGYVVIAGRLSDLDTQAYTEGTQLYLSSTTAGTWTSTKQYAPAHLVYVGIVVRAHPTQGIVEVKIQNGYELDELHNVAAQTPSNNDGLFYESSTDLWKNKSIATILGYTPQAQLNGTGFVKASGTTITYDNSTYVTTDTFQNISASKTFAVGFNIASAGGTNQISVFANTNSLFSGSGGSNVFGFNSANNIYFGKGLDNGGVLSWNNSAVRYYTLPDATGTIALVGGSGVGTVTSVGLSAPTGFSVSGSPVTSSGTLALSFASGYSLPTDTKQSNWDTAYNSRIVSVVAPLTFSLNTLGITQATGSSNGYLSSADWTTFNNKQSALTNPVTGTGTTNYIPKFTGTSTIGDSGLSDNGTTISTTENLSIGRVLTISHSYNPYITFDISGGQQWQWAGEGAALRVYNVTSGTNPFTIKTNDDLKLKSGSLLGWSDYSAGSTGVGLLGASEVLQFYTSGFERMRLNASGNLGLGVTPSAWNSGYKVMDVSAWGSIAGEFGTQGTISLVSNCFANSTGYNNWTYVNTAPATRYKQYNGEHQWFNAPSGTAGNAISFTQAMTLNASGNLSIGNTNNTYKLDVTGTGRFTDTLTGTTAIFNGFAINQNPISAGTGATFTRYLNSGNDVYIGIENSASSFFGASAYASVFYMGSTNLEMFWSGAKRVTITNSGAATFSSSVTATRLNGINNAGGIAAEFGSTTTANTYINYIYNNSAIAYIGNGPSIFAGAGTTDLGITTSGASALMFGTSNTERMRITSGGNVGIGTSAPTIPLQVNKAGTVNSIMTQTVLSVADSNGWNLGSDGTNALIGATNSGTDMVFLKRVAGVYSEAMRITSGGDICIASTSPVSTRRELRIGGNAAGSRISLGLNGTNYSALVTDSGGNVYLANEYNDSAIKLLMINYNNGVYLSQSATSWTANSDERLKDINGTIENAVDKLNSLRAVNFSWKSDTNKKEVLGLIAQDVAKVFPQVIDKNKIVNQNESIKDNTEYLGVRYTELVPVLVKAIQELKQELDTLKNK